jgi:hypothetical protein
MNKIRSSSRQRSSPGKAALKAAGYDLRGNFLVSCLGFFQGVLLGSHETDSCHHQIGLATDHVGP